MRIKTSARMRSMSVKEVQEADDHVLLNALATSVTVRATVGTGRLTFSNRNPRTISKNLMAIIAPGESSRSKAVKEALDDLQARIKSALLSEMASRPNFRPKLSKSHGITRSRLEKQAEARAEKERERAIQEGKDEVKEILSTTLRSLSEEEVVELWRQAHVKRIMEI